MASGGGRIGRLSQKRVEHARPTPGRRSTLFGDGGGLWLQTTLGDSGNIRRSWLFRYERAGVRHDMGLGPWPDCGLAEARERARRFRQMLRDDIDPLMARRDQRAAQRLEAAKALTFADCAVQYVETHEAGWRNAKHAAQWRATLTDHCRAIASLPVGEINTDLVLRVLTPLWKTRTATAMRLRGRIERVLSWAKGRGLREGENPARWSGHLDEMLPPPRKIATVKHLAALPYSELPTFMAALRERDSLAARALEFTILCAARTGEALGAQWGEIDLEAQEWRIPASRTKTGAEHRIPLPRRCLDILSATSHDHERVFPIADKAMLQIIRAMRPGVTVHGFRSAFRTWAAEQTNFPHEVCESALAHKVSDAVVRTYRRTDFFERRRALMELWARFCTEPPAEGEVVPLRRSAGDA